MRVCRRMPTKHLLSTWKFSPWVLHRTIDPHIRYKTLPYPCIRPSNSARASLIHRFTSHLTKPDPVLMATEKTSDQDSKTPLALATPPLSLSWELPLAIERSRVDWSYTLQAYAVVVRKTELVLPPLLSIASGRTASFLRGSVTYIHQGVKS